MSVTQNSLSKQLETVNLLHENALILLEAILEAISTNKELVEVSLTDGNGNTQIYRIPSNTFLKNEVDKNRSDINQVAGLTEFERGTLQLPDGSIRQIHIIDYKKVFSTLETLNLEPNNFVRVEDIGFLDKFLFPLTSVPILLDSNYIRVKEARVTKLILPSSDELALLSDGQSYSETINILNDNAVLFEEVISDIPVNPIELRFYGTFNASNLSVSLDGTITATFDKITYNDQNSTLLDTKELQVGDQFTHEDGKALFQVISVDVANNVVVFNRVAGYSTISTSMVLEYNDQTQPQRTVNMPIKANEYLVIFVSTIHPDQRTISLKSPSKLINTDNWNVFVDNESIAFNTYFNTNVLNIGEYLKSVVEESTIPNSLGISPDKPTLSTDNIDVVQVNGHLTTNSDITKLNKLIEQKRTTFDEIVVLNEEIVETNNRLSQGNYRSTKERSKDINKLNELQASKKQKNESYKTLVDTIASKTSGEGLITTTPKFRAKVLWNFQESIESSITRPQEIVQYRVRYRYLSPSDSANKSDIKKFTNSNGVEQVAAFPSWEETLTKPRKRVKQSDGTYAWEEPKLESPEEYSFNQIDLPISPGEKIQIRIQAISESGYPLAPIESEWSDTVDITFPNELLGLVELDDAIQQNIQDLQKVQLNQMFEDQGITTHTESQFYDQDKFFAHPASVIASGFLTAENRPITVFDKLLDLQNQITALNETINRRTATIDISVIDDNNQRFAVNEFGTVKLFAGYYTDNVDLTNKTQYGQIVRKIFYIKLTNINQINAELLSINPGSLNLDTNNTSYDQVPIAILNESTNTQLQKFGQVVYLRERDVTDQDDLYIEDVTTSEVEIPGTDIDGSAIEALKNVVHLSGGTTPQKVKILNGSLDETYISIHTDHPLYQAYSANPNATNTANLLAEFDRIKLYNTVLRSELLQTTYLANRATKFTINDRYMVGTNSVGSKFFLQTNDVKNIQVNGSANNSFRIIEPNESNSLLIPIVFEFRMTDRIGRVDGKFSKSVNDNFEYKKKIGVDLLISNQTYSFDIECSAKFRPETSSNNDLPVSRLDEIANNVNRTDTVTPKII